jgi:RimJ/RimL family protein N-acetyltransferase
MSIAPTPSAPGPDSESSDTAFLTTFNDAYVQCVTSWVRGQQELLWLAPGTPWPLTADKVLAWGQERRRRFLLWVDSMTTPVGYAELNEMAGRPEQMWIGHFIVDPAQRGTGLGTRFAQELVARAFFDHAASEVLLVVFPDNAGAIRCYERAGMKSMGRERKYFKVTACEHVVVRMGISAGRFTRLHSRQPTPRMALGRG